MGVSMIGTRHVLYLGKSNEIGPGEGVLYPAIKFFEVFYDERVICGFHVVAENGGTQ